MKVDYAFMPLHAAENDQTYNEIKSL